MADKAKAFGELLNMKFEYMVVAIMIGNALELIVNRKDNAEAKIEYYLENYDAELRHKNNKDIQIVEIYICNEYELDDIAEVAYATYGKNEEDIE